MDLCADFKALPLFYIAYGHPDLYRTGAKVFLDSIYETMEKVIDGETPLKLRLNFAHDTTLSIILNGLGFE